MLLGAHPSSKASTNRAATIGKTASARRAQRLLTLVHKELVMLISWETVLFTIALIAGLPIREDERSKHHGDSPDRVLPFRRM